MRHRERAHYERTTVEAILDEALICHVGFTVDGQPFVLPTTHARIDDVLYVHGAAGNHMLGAVADGAPLCVTVTLIDALVLARSYFRHSMNYRSVVVLGAGRRVTGREEKQRAMHALIERVHPGRSALLRPPTPQELEVTTVVALPIEEASAKIRTGPPIDLEADQARPCWAGVLPLELSAGTPVPDAHVPPGLEPPSAITCWSRKPRGG